MVEGTEVVVPVSLPRLLASLFVGVLGVVGGLFLIVGPGQILTIVASGSGGLAVFAIVMAVMARRPRVVITPKGFTVHKLFGEESYEWQDVHGQFGVITIGFSKAVGYNFTADYKARTGKKPTSLFSGYNAAISGVFTLSAEKLAGLLNAHRRAEAGDETVTAAQALIAPDAPAGENGSPILRVAAGVIALLFAGMLPLVIAQGVWDGAVLTLVLPFVFGWYAVRGRNGLPSFLTKKW